MANQPAKKTTQKGKTSGVAARVQKLEEDNKYLIWLLAELSYGIRAAVAAQVAQAVQPQLQQQILAQLLGRSPAGPIGGVPQPQPQPMAGHPLFGGQA